MVFLLTYLVAAFSLQWWQETAASVLWLVLITVTLAMSTALTLHPKSRTLGQHALAGTVGFGIAVLTVTAITAVRAPEILPARFLHRGVSMTGRVVDAPDIRPQNAKYTVAMETVDAGSGVIVPVSGLLLVTDKRMWPRLQYGQTVQIRGSIELPEVIEDFDYPAYLRVNGIGMLMEAWSIETVTAAPWSVMGSLIALRERTEARINQLFPEPHAALMAGLLTGSRKGLPQDLMQSFATSGLTHIVAISGFNIALIILALNAALTWLPLRWRTIPTIVAIALFTLFVGASSSVVRAAIMGSLSVVALHLGRTGAPRLTVLWALAAMAAWNPYALWNDAGLQLSFLAVLGLMELGGTLQTWLQRVPEFFGMREALAMTLAASVATLPLQLSLFGRMTILSPLANILVAPAIPLAMLFGALAILLSLIWMPLGLLPAFIGTQLLTWIITVATTTAAVPLSAINGLTLSRTAMLLIYAVVGVWMVPRWLGFSWSWRGPAAARG